MKIGVLTSSRADFGIYLPLLLLLEKDSFFDLTIIAFGTHLSKVHGYTLSEIEEHKFKKIETIRGTLLADDSPEGIATSYALTCMKFAQYWSLHKFDIVLCLGDRFEMQSAVQAGIPQRVIFAHIHGGETTEGAIDNVYRHQISLAAKLHFTSTAEYAKRVEKLTGRLENIFNVGALSLSGLENVNLPDFGQVKREFKLPKGDFILVTFHPETIAIDKNKIYAEEMYRALLELVIEYNLVITMPNADTQSTLFRTYLESIGKMQPDKIALVESFGKFNYFSVMKNSLCLLGNSSSGIIEAASFQKKVVNVGNRQKGRAQSENIINTDFIAQDIVRATKEAIYKGNSLKKNIYYSKNIANTIMSQLKEFFSEKL